MERRAYAGAWTALITPFDKNGALDESALRALVRAQIEAGITGLVPSGTTGESPTTTAEEDRRITEIVVDEARGRVRVMSGTGSNCTTDAVKYTKAAKAAGAECCLVVAPYYNKPTPEGLRRHYEAVADVGLPLIVYNIKGRTGINIDTNTLMDIARHPMVVGVKEASGNIEQMKDVMARRSEDFTVLSGDDGMTLDLMRAGGDGVISVASNILPRDVVKLVQHGLAQEWNEAERVNGSLSEMFDKLFIESNPVPVKYCAARLGLCQLTYRLPMCEPTAASQSALDEMLRRYELL